MKVILPYLSITPSRLCTYIKYDSIGNSGSSTKYHDLTNVDNRAHGLLSFKANKRVSRAIDWMIYLSKEKPLPVKNGRTDIKFKLNFITLTLSSPQIHTDNVIKSQLLNQFLTELRTKFNCTNYFWRAESQSNGRIHFHVCTDVFIPWRVLRSSWNRIQDKLGYVQRYTAKTGKSDPNSTDIHAINKVKNLASYLSKYCSKNAKGYTILASYAGTEACKPKFWLSFKQPKFNPKAKIYRQIHGKLWGQSRGLSRYSSAKCEITDEIQKELDFLQSVKADKVKFFERATLYLIDIQDIIKRKCMSIGSKFLNYVSNPNPPPPEPIQRTNIFEALRAITPVNVQATLNF